jgi:hypothetical protein
MNLSTPIRFSVLPPGSYCLRYFTLIFLQYLEVALYQYTVFFIEN